MERDFKGIWIPKEILSNVNLNMTEKIYLAIFNQYNKNMVFTENLMQHTVSYSSVVRVRNRLMALNLIENPFTKDAVNAKEWVLHNTDEGDTCEWCGKKYPLLETHHFPIPKCAGGTETVQICPNCHSAFHYICRRNTNGKR